MTSHEIFSRISEPQVERIFSYLLAGQKALYKATIDSVAKQRKLRPVFVERKPRAERHAWLREALGRKVNDGVAAHLLQIWLVGEHARLLCDFLDALGIAHDENGTIETLPQCPPAEKLAAAVQSLLEKHEREVVAIYLHFFHVMDGSWASLGEMLQSDPRLRLEETR
jgi:hypothetical protein